MARRTWILILGATLVHGILAGATVDRGLVGFPAWQRVGVIAWASYSRFADLGTGLLLYPTLAIGGALLSLAAAISLMRQPARQCCLTIAVWVAAVLALAGLLLTFKAAPFMLSLREIGNEDVIHLQEAFDGFRFWSAIRGVVQVLAYAGNLWSLVEIFRSAKINRV